MKIINELTKRAKAIDATIILPEANLDSRVMQACEIIVKKNLSKIIVLGKESEFPLSLRNSKLCKIIDIDSYSEIDDLTNDLYELRKHKGLTIDEAKKLILDPAYFSCMLLKSGVADGLVAGAKWTTANTLRPALQIIKTKPTKSIVTGAMLMLKKGKEPKLFADISLNVNPTSEELSEIAISSAEFMQDVVKVEPRVALLSYSTHGSAQSDMVTKVANATQLAKKSNFKIDGEMQADSALNIITAKKKGIKSEVGGHANVLIFPDLNAGNIGYKMVAYFGEYRAIGPIMLNFNKPVNDLSRGCTTSEIVDTVVITKLLTQSK